MNTNVQRTCLFLLGGWLGLSGCVDPGPIDPTVLGKYRQTMVLRSMESQPRDPGRLNPIGAGIESELKVVTVTVTDPETKIETKEEFLELTLEEAIHRTVANNLDIRALSFEPGMSREDMVIAAAVFDMVVFGGSTYSVEDERTNTFFDPTVLSKSHVFSVGVKQHMTTGADLKATYSLRRLETNTRYITKPTTYEPNFTLEMTQPLLRGTGPGEPGLATLRVARINHRIKEEEFRQGVETLVAETIVAYWTLRMERKELAIQKRLLKKTEDILVVLKIRAPVDATDLHLSQARASIAGRKAVIVRAEKTVRDIEDELVARMFGRQRAMGERRYPIKPVTLAQIGPIEIDGQSQLLAALKNNMDLSRLRLNVKKAGVIVRQAEQNILPQLNLTASATWMGLDKRRSVAHDQVFDSKYLSYGIGLVFEYPLGNRDAEAARRRARYERLQAVAALQSEAVKLAQKIKEKIREIERAQKTITIVQAVVKANKDKLKAIEALEEWKSVTPERLQLKLQTIEALGEYERNVEEAIIEYNKARVLLSWNTGTVLKQYGVVLVGSDEPGRDD